MARTSILLLTGCGRNGGGYSQVLYQKELLRCALSFEEKGIIFDKFVILTGQDYPLMSNHELVEFFSNSNRPFMIGENLTKDCDDAKYMERITQYHYLRDIHVRNQKVKQMFTFGARILMRLLPFRKTPFAIVNGKRWDVYYASAMVAFSHKAASVVYKELKGNTDLEKYFRTCYAPDELVIPTIVFNSSLKDHAALLPSWKRGLIRVSALEQFDYGQSIKVYTEKDYDELINCGKPFARKLETGKSDKLMDMLDKHNDYKKQ